MIKLGPNWVKDENFELRKRDTNTLEYWEKDNYLKLETEIGVGKDYFEIIYTSNIRNWTQPQAPISFTKLNEIKVNIMKAWAFLGDKLKFA